MRKNRFLKEETESLNAFLTLVEAYEEIAAIRMRKVRKTVLSRREFMQGLTEAFAYIIYAYKVFKKSINKSGEFQHILKTNGKTASVLLASNTGLYGEIIKKNFNLFWETVKDADTDIFIVGRLGRGLYDSMLGEKRNYEYFDMSDNGVDELGIKNLLDKLTLYSNVIVYHGVFKSILDQSSEKTFLTGEVMQIAQNLSEKNVAFLFEPSVEKIAEYFEKQVLSLIFEQTVFENSLSKYASRMVSLDSAAGNIHYMLDNLNFKIKKDKHKHVNAQLQSTVSGGQLWMK